MTVETGSTASRKNGLEDRIRTLDSLLRTADANATRGGAKGSKPNPAWRKFVKEWKVFEGAREDAEEDFINDDGSVDADKAWALVNWAAPSGDDDEFTAS